MDWMVNTNDIILDEAAFDKAIADFADLAVQLQSLREDVESLLSLN